MSLAISLVALVVALAALALAWRSGAGAAAPDPGLGSDLPADARGLRHEVAALREEAARALQNLAVVRYDAFSDSGGGLSWSLALLDANGDGAVITSIHGRTEARAYAKAIREWSCDQPLSAHEEQAVARARP